MRSNGGAERHYRRKTIILVSVLTTITALLIGGYWAYQEAAIAQNRQVTSDITHSVDARLAEIEAKKPSLYIFLCQVPTNYRLQLKTMKTRLISGLL